jgi:serine/threonine-protein kinase
VSFAFAMWVRAKRTFTTPHVLTLSGLVFATLASVACYLGPFVIVPQSVAVATLWISVQSRTRLERIAVIAMGVAAVALPFLIEFAHLVAPAYEFVPGGLLLHARSVVLSPHTTVPMLFYSSLTFVALPGVFFSGVRTAMLKAERQLFLQAWHLRQLASDTGAAPAN